MDGRFLHERRTVQRRAAAFESSLCLHAEPHGPAIPAGVTDISISGIGVLVDRSFEPGTALTVQPGAAGRTFPAPLLAEVRHAHMLAGGSWLLGCSFSRNLTTEDVMELG